MQSIFMLCVISIGIVTLVGVWAITVHKGLEHLHNQVKGAWARVDVQLRQRYDLLANMLEIVKRFPYFENVIPVIVEEVCQARLRALRATGIAERAQADRAVSEAIGQLMRAVEDSPELTANQEFHVLQEALVSTTQQVRSACKQYNAQVLAYHTRLQSLPVQLLVALLFVFEEEALFEMQEPEIRIIPHVQHAA